MTASDIFEAFAADHTVELPALPVTDFVRLDTPTVYAIHDYGLIGTGECLYIGKTERPFENLYERFVVASSPFRTKLEADAEADSDPAESDGGSNYLYENTRVSVATLEAPEQLTALERAAIGRVGPPKIRRPLPGTLSSGSVGWYGAVSDPTAPPGSVISSPQIARYCRTR